MKVMCISKELPKEDHPILIQAANDLTVGEIYTVIYEEPTLYELAEFHHPRGILWEKKNFIPLSQICETTFERDYNKELQPK